MRNIKVYLINTDPREEIEIPMKGMRDDIYVKLDSSYYRFCAYDTVSFKQLSDRFIEQFGYDHCSENIIFIPEVTREHIINAIKGLAESKRHDVFSNLKPLDQEEVKELELTKIYPKEG